MEETTLCVVEDHPVLREALSLMLGHDGFRVLGGANTAADGFELVVRSRPDVAIVDLLLGEDRGDELARLLLAALPELKVVVFTGSEQHADLELVLECGAQGVVSKTAPPEDLRAALRLVAAGGTYVDQRVTAVLATQRKAVSDLRLSAREREVLVLLARGMTIDQTASMLGLSPETVRTHARNAGRRLGGRSRVHTIALALASGEIAI